MIIARMYRTGIFLSIFGVLISGCGPSPEEQAYISAGQTAVAAPPAQTPTVGNLHMPFHMETSYLESADIDRIYNLYISLPYDYHQGSRKYPVIYVLDGDLLFGTVKEVVLHLSYMELKDSIVVGIGYDTDVFEDILTNRYQDLAPNGPNYPEFTQFFLNDLIPFIESDFRVDSSDRTLVGYSTSGVSAISMMFEYPGEFSKIVTISPELRRNQKAIFDVEEKYSDTTKELPVILYLSVGSKEDSPVSDFLPDLLEFSAILKSRDYSDFIVITDIIDGENHNSVVPFAISKGIRAVNEFDDE